MEYTHVDVVIYHGRTEVASEDIRSGARFSFRVHPGSYRVAVGHRSDDVTVEPGRTVTASLLTVCM